MTTIPASSIVSVTPNVLAAGGSGLDLIGLILTNGTRVPIGAVQPFPSAAAVSEYFGPASVEAAVGAGYFAGFENSNIKPGSVLFAQYNEAAVSAFLRGGDVSSLTLSQLQALNALLSVTIDGVVESATIDLATATSFSAAAALIADGLGITGVVSGSVTGSIGGTFTGTTAGTVITVSAVITGSLRVGDVVSANDGTNSLPGGCTIVSQVTGTAGGTGTYTISAAAAPGNLTSTTITSLSTTLSVTAVISGVVEVTAVISGTGITAGTYVTGQISGTTGGVGLYSLSDAQTVTSTTVTARSPAVQYDSVSGGFVIRSGTTGPTSLISFGSGALATSLELTSATGAVLSQGKAISTPSAFMDSVVDLTRNWATFMTTFDPDDTGNANKLLFATWNGLQNNRFAYICWDTDAAPTTTVPVPTSLRALVDDASISGTTVIYAIDADQGPLIAAFVCGAAASIDFFELNGRTTFAGRRQSGLAASVTTETAAANLLTNGYNFVGAYATANEEFVIYENGSVSGDFLWLDSFLNEVWLTNAFQLVLVELLVNAKSIPYNSAGYTKIEAALNDPINAGINFGAIRAGVTLSASQVAAVNADAGKSISNTLTTRGWYLLVSDASAAVRAARASPPCKFWYTDGQSVQKIDLTSIAIL